MQPPTLQRHVSDLGLDESIEAGTSAVLPPSAGLYPSTVAAIVLFGALGSAVGGGIRTVVTLYTSPWRCACDSSGKDVFQFPAATYMVNIGGSLLAGLFSRLSLRFDWDPRLTASLGAGFCGGLTTMSTFAVETLLLMESRFFGTAACYFFGTTGSCLLTAFIGWSLGGAGGGAGGS